MASPTTIDSRRAVDVSAPSLEWLIGPITASDFLNNYWEKQPLVVNRNQPRYLEGLLSLAEVDRVITTTDRRYPDITLKNASRDITAKDFTSGGDRLDVARLYQLFDEGSTIALSFLDTVVPALTLFCRSLESEISHPFQTNVYLTPPGAQGAKPHYDTHDVFVLQIEGSKDWTIYGTPVSLPLPSQDFDESVHQLGEPTLQFRLEAGDVAYIPRGVGHDAHSTNTVSLHITAGILRYTWAELLIETLGLACQQDPLFRKSVPPGFARQEFDRAKAMATLQELFARAAVKVNFEEALDHFIDRSVASSPPLLTGQMAQLEAARRLTLDDRVGVRPGTNYRLHADDSVASVDCFGRKITFPSYAVAATRFALNHSEFTVRDLPGSLDDEGKLTLARRLIREGLLMTL